MSLLNFVLKSNTMNLPPELMGEIPELLSGFQPLITKLSVVVGGIFGLYFILILVRVYYERRKVKILEDIRYDLDRVNDHQGISYSAQRRRLLGKVMTYISKYASKSVHKELEKMRKNRLKSKKRSKLKHKSKKK
jgi:hypothetical protein